MASYKPKPTLVTSTTKPTSSVPTYSPPPPSLRLLFSYLTRRDVYLYLLPAIFSSMAAGGIAPFMTRVIGQVFDALARYPQSTEPPSEAKHKLLHAVGIGSLQLVALAAGTLVLSSIMASLWMWVGERNALRLRKAVYESITSREMHWFDLKLGGDSAANGSSASEGAGGFMSKFTRDTDDVRTAAALNTGMLVQYLTTFFTCLILALVVSWSLTLVILSSIPLLVFIQGVSQSIAVPLYNSERKSESTAGTHIERAVRSIATVKAFNAQTQEQKTVDGLFDVARRAYAKCCVVWGVTAGLTQFILFAMFVQGFWYGSHLVRQGKISPGSVMAVFWACLIASSNLQLCVPLLVLLTKGKAAMASLHALIHTPTPSFEPETEQPLTPTAATHNMTKIVPQGKTHGAFHLQSVRFAYPTRPEIRVLEIDDIYLASNETTFIVGGSGSGKSTIAQLLLRLYKAQSGTITFDDQDISFLDDKYIRAHVAAVAQTCVLFDMSVHDNVALGVAGSGKMDVKNVTREEVEKVCRAAMMHEFVRDLPEGYDTKLGNGGTSLSGGQRQRLAIARALLRDPTVLLLDEATSALDATSRVLVFEAIKASRRNRTTVVITHDLSQITRDDFVYVMKDGAVVEQGFRSALEGVRDGEFRRMLTAQSDQGGFPVKGDAELGLDDGEEQEALEDWEEVDSDVSDEEQLSLESSQRSKHASLGGSLLAHWKHLSTSLTRSTSRATRRSMAPRQPAHYASAAVVTPNWMIDAVSDLATQKSSTAIHQAVAARRASGKLAPPSISITVGSRGGRRSFQVAPGGTMGSLKPTQEEQPRPSLQFEPMSPTTPINEKARVEMDVSEADVEDDEEFEAEKNAMRATAAVAGARRQGRTRHPTLDAVVVRPKTPLARARLPSLAAIARRFYPTLPNKVTILFGIILCLINGALTPVFSVCLSELMAQVGSGARDSSQVAFWGMMVLLIAAADGMAAGTKFFLMETAAMRWVTSLRKQEYQTVMKQDKAFFDREGNEPQRVVQILVKDGDDARALISTILAQMVVVISMLSVGLIWALVRGWQLTLVGFAIGPVFAVAMAAQSSVMSKYEIRSKRAREDVAKRYFEAVQNVRAIRSMALEGVFTSQFDDSLQNALKAGVSGAIVAGTGYGVANALVYVAEALLFYVGAVMMSKNTYSYLQLVEVLNLVVFTVSIAAQIMTFIPKIAKASAAANDIDTLLSNSQPPEESKGDKRFPIRGDLTFDHVNFCYPSRPDVPVLQNASFTIHDGECVGVVGPSGSGKSTIAALLQRLYQPDSGSIKLGRFDLTDTDTVWLRSHMAVVSQQPALFDSSIKENIVYGLAADSVPFHEVQRAARDANLDDFIRSLPDGYDTPLGENASLVSGGQAQRIQLARALVNGTANILLLDEFTSALDSQNQESLMATVMKLKEDRTTIIVTHKVPVMKQCDRLIVVKDGQVVEEGTYESLMRMKGDFWTMVTAGDLAAE